EQYRQLERGSVARAIFSACAFAKPGRASKPSSSAAAPPAVPTLKNSRLDKSMAMPPQLGISTPGLQRTNTVDVRQGTLVRVRKATRPQILRLWRAKVQFNFFIKNPSSTPPPVALGP